MVLQLINLAHRRTGQAFAGRVRSYFTRIWMMNIPDIAQISSYFCQIRTKSQTPGGQLPPVSYAYDLAKCELQWSVTHRCGNDIEIVL